MLDDNMLVHGTKKGPQKYKKMEKWLFTHELKREKQLDGKH